MSTNLRVALDGGRQMNDIAQTAKRYKVALVQPWDLEVKRQLQALGCIVICHKNLAGASDQPGPNGIYSTGLSAQAASQWLLTDKDGDLVTFNGYPHLFACDIGDPNYQQTWAAAVCRELAAARWDGVLLDNADATMAYDFAPPPKYPTDTHWQAAMAVCLGYVGAKLKQAKLLALPNIGGYTRNVDVATSWLKYVDGAMAEQYCKWGQTAGVGYLAASDWLAVQQSLYYGAARGKRMLVVTHSTANDHAAAIYGWASALMASGKTSYCFAGGDPCYTQEIWWPEFEAKLGMPTGKPTLAPNGYWVRSFKRGSVRVNPTTHDAVIAQ